eukprot:12922385-Prorocentrum_lima.AAC.1
MEAGTGFGDASGRAEYETVDYVIASQRCRNNVPDGESDVRANISAYHYPFDWHCFQASCNDF